MKKNNQNGITLIALVVTIIVLLILAGVSIAMLSGQNGILNRATEATWKDELGEAKDLVSLNTATYLTEYYAYKYAGATDVDTTVQGFTDENDCVDQACTDAEATTGLTITYTEASGTIVIESSSGSVTGTVSGSSVNWGEMTEK